MQASCQHTGSYLGEVKVGQCLSLGGRLLDFVFRNEQLLDTVLGGLWDYALIFTRENAR